MRRPACSDEVEEVVPELDHCWGLKRPAGLFEEVFTGFGVFEHEAEAR